MQLIASVVIMKIDLYISLEKVYPQLSRKAYIHVYFNFMKCEKCEGIYQILRATRLLVYFGPFKHPFAIKLIVESWQLF